MSKQEKKIEKVHPLKTLGVVENYVTVPVPYTLSIQNIEDTYVVKYKPSSNGVYYFDSEGNIFPGGDPEDIPVSKVLLSENSETFKDARLKLLENTYSGKSNIGAEIEGTTITGDLTYFRYQDGSNDELQKMVYEESIPDHTAGFFQYPSQMHTILAANPELLPIGWTPLTPDYTHLPISEWRNMNLTNKEPYGPYIIGKQTSLTHVLDANISGRVLTSWLTVNNKYKELMGDSSFDIYTHITEQENLTLIGFMAGHKHLEIPKIKGEVDIELMRRTGNLLKLFAPYISMVSATGPIAEGTNIGDILDARTELKQLLLTATNQDTWVNSTTSFLHQFEETLKTGNASLDRAACIFEKDGETHAAQHGNIRYRVDITKDCSTLEFTRPSSTWNINNELSLLAMMKIIQATALESVLSGKSEFAFLQDLGISKEGILTAIDNSSKVSNFFNTYNKNGHDLYSDNTAEFLVNSFDLLITHLSDHFNSRIIERANNGKKSILSPESETFEDLLSGKSGTVGSVVCVLLKKGHTEPEIMKKMIASKNKMYSI